MDGKARVPLLLVSNLNFVYAYLRTRSQFSLFFDLVRITGAFLYTENALRRLVQANKFLRLLSFLSCSFTFSSAPQWQCRCHYFVCFVVEGFLLLSCQNSNMVGIQSSRDQGSGTPEMSMEHAIQLCDPSVTDHGEDDKHGRSSGSRIVKEIMLL